MTNIHDVNVVSFKYWCLSTLWRVFLVLLTTPIAVSPSVWLTLMMSVMCLSSTGVCLHDVFLVLLTTPTAVSQSAWLWYWCQGCVFRLLVFVSITFFSCCWPHPQQCHRAYDSDIDVKGMCFDYWCLCPCRFSRAADHAFSSVTVWLTNIRDASGVFPLLVFVCMTCQCSWCQWCVSLTGVWRRDVSVYLWLIFMTSVVYFSYWCLSTWRDKYS